MTPRPPRGDRPRPPRGYKPKGKKLMDTIYEEKEMPSIRFTNFSPEQSLKFLENYMRRPVYTDMTMPLKMREQNNRHTQDLLSSAALLSTPAVPPSFPKSHISYIKTPFYPDESKNVIRSLGVQYGLGGSQTNVMLKEVFLSEIILTKQYHEDYAVNEVNIREVLKSLTMELYILHNLRHENILTPLKVYTEPNLGRYQIAFTPHVPLRKIMDETMAQLPGRTCYFDTDDIPRFIVHEVALALEFLVHHKVSHNNVCADTIYINSNGMVRLGDFERCTRNEHIPKAGDDDYIPRSVYYDRPVKDVHNLATLYTKLIISGYIEKMMGKLRFRYAFELCEFVEDLVNSFDYQLQENPAASIPLDANQVQFLLACYKEHASPTDLLDHPYVAEVQPWWRDMLRGIIKVLEIPLKSRVMTGPHVAPLVPPPEKTIFELSNPVIEFELAVEDEGALNHFFTKFVIPANDTRYWMAALYEKVIDTKCKVPVRRPFNYEPPEILAIHVEMEKVLKELDGKYCDWVEQNPGAAIPHMAIKHWIRVGYNGNRKMMISGRLHSIKKARANVEK
uniref:Protein kinase domain-containing protein n=1 Tax=Panagrellus redivivus TaxID=6233 RepID=A0A7E4V010_PANRE